MNIPLLCAILFQRLRLPAAFLCALVALPMLWAGLGLSVDRLLPGKALAGAEQDSGRAAALALLPEKRVLLLQSSVDSLALGLGAALPPDASGEDKDQALARALNALTFSLGGDVYFTAWQGTRIVHAPLNADAAGLDFASSLDGRGAPFVLGMEELAGSEGGFLRVLLPPQRRAAPAPGVRLPMDDMPEAERSGLFPPGPALCPPDGGPACPLPGHAAPAQGMHGEPPAEAPVEQVVYVRGIPGNDRHIAVFLPARPGPLPPPAGEREAPRPAFSSLWAPDDSLLTARKDERFRKGLRISGLSLACLAGLMLVPSARSKGGDPDTDKTPESARSFQKADAPGETDAA